MGVSLFVPSFFYLYGESNLSDRIKFPESWKGEHFASNDLINNPLSISIDANGRVYVVDVEKFRRGAQDARSLPDTWFVDEVQLTDLESRKKMNLKYENNGVFKPGHFTSADDRVFWIEDQNEDGKAETKGLFADGFNDSLSGIGSSILHDPDGSLYYANIPNIWKISPPDEKGHSTGKESLVYGFGLRYGVAGHDLHGLEWGLDGRVYFSMGDRGFDITSKEGNVFKSIDRGAVFRCEPDGSNLEMICIGNRNPQDLEFDNYGRLFSVDNNRGRGDLSRLYEVVEGGDYAWYNGYENIKTFVKKVGLSTRQGPGVRDIWSEERSWDVEHDSQAYYVIPSLSTTMGGPAGITMVPGESMGEDFEDTFLFTNCRAGLLGFEIEDGPEGKSVMKNWRDLSTGGYFVDVDFDSEGRLYLADYVGAGDVEGKTKGEIYRFTHPVGSSKESVKDASQILKAGFGSVTKSKLIKFLSHRDRRVRFGAQTALVRKGITSIGAFSKVIRESKDIKSKVHAVYGLGTLARLNEIDLSTLVSALKDNHPHIRAIAATVLGESKKEVAFSIFKPLLNDPHSRVRQSAIKAIGNSSSSEAFALLMNKVKGSEVFNPYVRNAMSLALYKQSKLDVLEASINSQNKQERLMALLVYARASDERVAQFLKDPEHDLVNEAIRNIERLQLKECYVSAVELLDKPDRFSNYQLERLIFMAMRTGEIQGAKKLVDLLLNKNLSKEIRYRAVGELLEWRDASLVDPVFGQVSYRNEARGLLKPSIEEKLDSILNIEDLTLLSAAIKLISKEGLKVDTEKLITWTKNTSIDLKTRLSSFETLINMGESEASMLSEELSYSKEEELRFEALKYLSKSNSTFVIERVKKMAGEAKDLRVCYRILPFLPTHVSYGILEKGFQALKEKKHVADGCVELIDAIEKVNHSQLMTEWLNLSKNDEFHHSIYKEGGDVSKGKEVVMSHGTAQCTICHKVGRDGTGVVGPNLQKIGDKGEAYLTRALLQPSADVANGFGFTILNLKDGKALVGTLLWEKDNFIKIKVNDEELTVKKEDILSRVNAVSSMPPMGYVLNKREIRNVLAYLNTLTSKKKSVKKKDH